VKFQACVLLFIGIICFSCHRVTSALCTVFGSAMLHVEVSGHFGTTIFDLSVNRQYVILENITFDATKSLLCM